MVRPKIEVADVFRRYGPAYRLQHGASLSVAQRRVMTAIESCRTAVLGGHLERCDQCGHERNAYNSCSDRHCPKCQSLARAEWLEKRRSELLDTQYFHVVFTLPEQIAPIAYQNKKVVYGILFRATAETLRTIAADPKHLGAEIGFFASPSPPALRRSRRRPFRRRYAVDFLPTRILLTRAGTLSFIPAAVLGISAPSL
jgi:Transposase zinc-binding domain